MKMILRSAGLAVVLLTVSLGTRTAQGATCEGTCTASCDSGATYSYYEPNYQCCDHFGQACPDGSSAHAVEWWPVTCGNPETC
jgi:hypothetical protein